MTENSTGAGTETPASAFHALLELSAARDPAGPHSLNHDLETRSKVDLKEAGAAKYASDPSTEVLCLCYAVDDEPVQLWTPGDPIPSEFIEAERNPLWTTGAHNDAFERLISRHKLEALYGFPAIPIERRRCSMAMAYAAALPGSLEKVVEVLGLPFPKDKAGQALMRRMSKPLPGGGWLDDAVSRERLHVYCKRDVEAERAVYKALPQLTAEEQRLWTLDAVINDRGFAIDGELLEAADRIVTASEASLQAEFREITGLGSTHQTQKFIDWLAMHDCEVEDVQKGTLHHALRRKGLEDGVRRAIELRLQLAHASATKIKALLAWRIDNRVRGSLIFHGASTSRWTARGPQPQNFKRDSEGMDVKVAAVLNGGAGLASPVETVGDIARAMIVAAPGHRLMIGDFSGIESRVIAWISGQLSKLEQWAKFDRTGALADDPYYILGRACGLAEDIARPNGKICDLAFGYQGGLGAWKNQAPENDPSTDDDIRRYQKNWKARHPFTVAFWKGIDSKAIAAVRTPGKAIEYKRMRIVREGEFLRITLPSGRALSYPFPRIITDPKYDQRRVIFKDASGGKWSDCNFGKGAYGGLWTENIVSAIARDLLAGAMLRLDAAGYRVVLTVHDEVVVEVPDGFGSLDEFKRLLTAAPDWVDGTLPIAAKVRESRRFSKPDAPNGKAAPQATPAPAERPQLEMPVSEPPAPRSPKPIADPETLEDLLAALPDGDSNEEATGEEVSPWSVASEDLEEPPGPSAGPPGPPGGLLEPPEPPGPPGRSGPEPGLAASFEVGAGGNELAAAVLRVRAEIQGLYAVTPLRHSDNGGNDAGHGGSATAEGGGDNGFDAAADGQQQEDVSRLGNVIILSAEEDAADSLVPRLHAAGVDPKRVCLEKMVREPGEDGQEHKRMFSLVTDLEMLRQRIIDMGDVVAVFIDPITSYLGIDEVDSYRDTDVRAVLGPLKELAEEMRIAIIAIMHFNKKTDVTNALLRISNSLAFVGLPRHVYAVVADAENERKLLVRAKNNDAAASDNQTLAYHFEVSEVGFDAKLNEVIRAPFIVWEPDYVDITANEAMQAAGENKSPGERDKAKTLLLALLADGCEVFVEEIKDAANGHNLSWRTMRRAGEDLGVIIEKERGTPKGKWFWRLPPQE